MFSFSCFFEDAALYYTKQICLGGVGMAIGNNMKRLRNLRGMTQRELGVAIGFDQKTADVRIAQYESGTRTPKENLIADIAGVLNVNPLALTTPDIESYYGLMHTFFTLEDVYGLTVTELDGTVCLKFDPHNKHFDTLFHDFQAWLKASQRLASEEITKQEYDEWRYQYPRFEAEATRKKLDELRQKSK